MSEVTYRRATLDDVSTVVTLLSDDPIGAAREDPSDLAPYARAFAQIATDPHQVLSVAERDGEVVGTLQLTIIPGLSRRGATRAQIEGVRVRADERGSALGAELIAWAVQESRRRGCSLVQLTSDASRPGAHRFYERLGFTASHVGFKQDLS